MTAGLRDALIGADYTAEGLRRALGPPPAIGHSTTGSSISVASATTRSELWPGSSGSVLRSTISDPYFFPMYELAEKLNFCIGLHQANGSAAAVDMMVNPDGSRDFLIGIDFNVGAMFRILNCGIPQKFPKLRFGFIETAASWVPWVIYELRRRLDTVNKKLPNDLLEQSGIFVTCQIGDDVPYLIKSCMGENTLMIGTDYGHADSSTELDAFDHVERRRRHQRRHAQKNRRR